MSTSRVTIRTRRHGRLEFMTDKHGCCFVSSAPDGITARTWVPIVYKSGEPRKASGPDELMRRARDYVRELDAKGKGVAKAKPAAKGEGKGVAKAKPAAKGKPAGKAKVKAKG